MQIDVEIQKIQDVATRRLGENLAQKCARMMLGVKSE